MRLQRQISRQIDGNEYAKWVIVVPPSQIEELGWQEGVELESIVGNGKLVITIQMGPKEERPKKMAYQEFKEKIRETLKVEPEGSTWTELRNKLGLRQKVPNNLWVRTMERDIGLLRQLDNKTGKTIWKLRASGDAAP